MADSARTFRHRFRGGVTCEIRIDLDKLRARRPGCLRCEWSRNPGRHVIPEYRRWILSVWQRVSNETGLKTIGDAAGQSPPVGNLGLRAGQSTSEGRRNPNPRALHMKSNTNPQTEPPDWRATEISMVASARGTETSSTTVADILDAIKSGKWAKEVKPITAKYASAFEAAKLEGKADPATVAREAVRKDKEKLAGILFSGTFSRRTAVAIEQHSGLSASTWTTVPLRRNSARSSPPTNMCHSPLLLRRAAARRW
jgi:hypothetical protein